MYFRLSLLPPSDNLQPRQHHLIYDHQSQHILRAAIQAAEYPVSGILFNNERLWMEERKDNNTVTGRTDYSYNALKQLTSETRTFSGLAGTYSVGYAWNLVGGLTRATTTVGSWSKNVNYGWNYAGAATGVGTNIIGTDATTTTNIVNTLAYRGFGAIRSMKYGNDRDLTVSYNVRQQLSSLLTKRTSNASDMTINQVYDYYNGGNGKNIAVCK